MNAFVCFEALTRDIVYILSEVKFYNSRQQKLGKYFLFLVKKEID